MALSFYKNETSRKDSSMTNYKIVFFGVSWLFFFLLSHFCFAQLDKKSSEALIKRVIPDYAKNFQVEALLDVSTVDAFEIESKGKKIILRGNNGASVASALYYYIKEYAGGQITWNGDNLKIPEPLPQVPGRIRKTTSYEYRYYLNYCTFNYSMSWWDWPRWEKEIDWMALHGINMPLSITGQEYTVAQGSGILRVATHDACERAVLLVDGRAGAGPVDPGGGGLGARVGAAG
jgi:hypothetical protein